MKKILFLIFSLVLWDVFVVRSQLMSMEVLSSARFLSNYLVTLLFGAWLVILCFGVIKKKWVRLIFCTLFLFVSIVQVQHYRIYDKPVSAFGMQFFFQNTALALQLGQDTANWSEILLGVATLFACLYLARSVVIKRFVLFYFLGFFLLGVDVASALSWYGKTEYQHALGAFATELVGFGRRPNGVSTATNREPFQLPKWGSEAGLPNIIWVVGESMVANRTSLYGAERNTTPRLKSLLDQGRLIRYDNAVSIGTVTRISVPYMMKGIQAIDPKGVLYHVPSVLDYAAARGYQTAYISAQELKWGELDKIIISPAVEWFQNGSDFDPRVGVSKGAWDLRVLQEGVLPWIAKSSPQKPFLMIFHMDGSHYPYATHSPREAKQFLPEEDRNGANAYDNTLYYSDMVLDELIRVAKEKDPNIWIFYTSDHGQNVDANGSRFNQGYSEQVIKNPLFIVPPADRIADLKKNIGAPVSQADVYATCIDLMKIPDRPFHDGRSLLSDIPADRIRFVGGYMANHFTQEDVLVVHGNGDYEHIDFIKNQFQPVGAKEVGPIRDPMPPYYSFLKKRLQGDQVFQNGIFK